MSGPLLTPDLPACRRGGRGATVGGQTGDILGRGRWQRCGLLGTLLPPRGTALLTPVLIIAPSDTAPSDTLALLAPLQVGLESWHLTIRGGLTSTCQTEPGGLSVFVLESKMSRRCRGTSLGDGLPALYAPGKLSLREAQGLPGCPGSLRWAQTCAQFSRASPWCLYFPTYCCLCGFAGSSGRVIGGGSGTSTLVRLHLLASL